MALKTLFEAIQPLVVIAKAYMDNELDDEARRFWGRNTGTENENNRDPKSIELYSGRGGRQLLTLQDCIDAAEAAKAADGLTMKVMEKFLKEPTTSAPPGCYCKGTCGAPVIMGRQQPCRRPGGVPGMPAPDDPVAMMEGVSRSVADGISGVTGAIATADARASGQQIPKRPGRCWVADMGNGDFRVGTPDGGMKRSVTGYFSEAQAHRIAALINADRNFPWDA